MPITLTSVAIGDLRPVYDGRLVALSLLIALLAAWACLDLAGPAAVAHGRARTLWLTGAALALGLGIWAMHFVAMLAYRLPLPVTYDAIVVLLALGVALGGSGAGLALAARRPVRGGAPLAAGAAVGGAIVGMHYTGMAGVRAAAMPMLDPLPLALSALLALGLSGASLWLAFAPRAARSWPWHPRAAGAAALLAAAIAGMHYAAMAGVHLMPVAALPAAAAAAEPTLAAPALAETIGLATVAVLGATLAASFVGRRARTRLANLASDTPPMSAAPAAPSTSPMSAAPAAPSTSTSPAASPAAAPPSGDSQADGPIAATDERATIPIGALVVGPSRHEVRFRDVPVALTLREYALLRHLAEHPGQVRPYDEIAWAMHGLRLPASEARTSLHTHVGNLRRKLDPAYLVTDPGAGYMLTDPHGPP